jgi:hypothetical protein
MPRTIEDREYNFLQGRRQVADFVESIWNDPQLNTEAKALVKRKYPNLKIPDYDLEQHVNKRIDEDRRERREAEENKKFSELRANTQKQYGFTDEAMKDLEKFMVEKNVGDYDVAAGYLASKEPPKTSQATYQDQYWNHGKGDNWKEVTADPEGWARGEILKTIYTSDQQRGNRKF